jgi:hypothetical protein
MQDRPEINSRLTVQLLPTTCHTAVCITKQNNLLTSQLKLFGEIRYETMFLVWVILLIYYYDYFTVTILKE